MESCIKYTNLRYTRHQFGADINTDQVCRIVKRCKIVALFYCCDHFICDHCRSCKFFSTMYDTMSDCIYFFQRSFLFNRIKPFLKSFNRKYM